MNDQEPRTVEERKALESGMDLPISIKILNTSADTFTPKQIKFLSKGGRRNMGVYGLCSIIFMIIILGMNLWGIIESGEDRPLIIFNLMLPSIIFFMSIFSLIGKILNSVLKQFQ
jgi:quinol-cytochrome oxidoreductase complex cytochrome b subunit